MNEGFNHNIITVKHNMQGYTTRQIRKADEARKLYHIIGTPTVENFKGLLKMNMIANNPITVEDVDRAEKIYGPSIYSMKGKTTRAKPKVVVNDTIDIPKELITKNYYIDLCIDIIYVNGLAFLSSIDKQIKYRTIFLFLIESCNFL